MIISTEDFLRILAETLFDQPTFSSLINESVLRSFVDRGLRTLEDRGSAEAEQDFLYDIVGMFVPEHAVGRAVVDSVMQKIETNLAAWAGSRGDFLPAGIGSSSAASLSAYRSPRARHSAYRSPNSRYGAYHSSRRY